MSGYRQFKRGKTHAFGFSDWDEEKHPRDGGKFAPKEGEGGREGAHAVAESVNLEGVPEKIQADIMNQAATLQREYGVPPLDEIEVGKAHEGHSGALSFVLDLDTTPPGKRLVIDKDFLARLEGEGVTLDEWALGRSDLQSGSASDLIAHEMAHYYHRTKMGGDERDALENAWQKEGYASTRMSEYSKKNEHEFYAEMAVAKRQGLSGKDLVNPKAGRAARSQAEAFQALLDAMPGEPA